MSKREQSATLVESYVNIFQCPICGSSMYVAELKSIKCSKNHSFDLARQGYLNLLITPTKTKYDKQLFESRKYLMGNTHFSNP